MPSRTLVAVVFITDPRTRETILLTPGTKVTDPVIERQITHPAAWADDPLDMPRRAKRSS